MVSKEARVTGEVVIKKGVEQHTETVSDKVRSTKVDVEDDRVATDKATLNCSVRSLPGRTRPGPPLIHPIRRTTGAVPR